MTIELTHGSARGARPGRASVLERMRLAAMSVRDAVQDLYERLRAAADLHAARKRRRLRGSNRLDDRIYTELAQARAELEFTYRNNLDLR